MILTFAALKIFYLTPLPQPTKIIFINCESDAPNLGLNIMLPPQFPDMF